MNRQLLTGCLVLFLQPGCFSQSFNLPVPAGWTSEIIKFPIEFAPTIPYAGEEYLRFAPKWGDPASEELWTYSYLWWIKGDTKITKESLERDLTAYYNGLVGRNIIIRKIDSTKVVPTLVTITQIKHEPGFGKSFMGTVRMLDYLSLKPVTLNFRIHTKTCEGQLKLGVMFLVSPQGITHPIWQKLKSIQEGFRCSP